MDVVDAFCRRHGRADADGLIRELCSALVARSPGIPVDLDQVARQRGIVAIEYADLGPGSNWWPLSQEQHPGAGWAAVLVDHRGAYKAILDATDPPERQRFSLAHEIAHTFFLELEHEADQLSMRHERLCDLGAAELLMPATIFGPELDADVLTLRRLIVLANRYQASLQAVCRRAMALTSQIACVWVVERSRPGQLISPEAPPLVTRCYVSQLWSAAHIFEGTVVLDSSVAARALNAELELSATETLPGGASGVVEAIGYRFRGGRLDGHARAVALVKPTN